MEAPRKRKTLDGAAAAYEEALLMISPGTRLREAMSAILQSGNGALICIGDVKRLADMSEGGVKIDAPFTPQLLYELAKMDGAIILDKGASRIAYANRILKDPKISPTYEEDLERRKSLEINTASQEKVRILSSHRLVLFLFLFGMILLVFGILHFKWYINEIAGLFLALGIFSGILGRLSSTELAKSFVDGAKDMINAALIIGCARAILVVAMDGKILDTLLHSMARVISNFHPVISSQLMFICQCIINFFVHSGTAQAALTMPIMAPLGDLVGITRQTSVFAFQLAEYINPVLPTSGVTMGVLGLARLNWEKWAKWLIPLLLLWVIFGLLSLIPPVLMRWGPA